MSKWIYRGAPLKEPIEGVFGFVYKVTFPDGRFYVGSKSFWSVTNPKISKKRAEELYSGKGRKKTKERKIKESKWREYLTSSKLCKEIINEFGVENCEFIVIDTACSKSDLLYKEAKMLMCTDWIIDPRCINDWISLKIRKNNLC